MPICGLSNQWKTREALLDLFRKFESSGKYEKILLFLEMLDACTGATIYVGTSLEQMNFSTRDVVRDDDRTQPFAYVEVCRPTLNAGYCFLVETRKIDGLRPTSEWIKQYSTDAESVVHLVIEALSFADIPPKPSLEEGHKK